MTAQRLARRMTAQRNFVALIRLALHISKRIIKICNDTYAKTGFDRAQSPY